MPSSSDNTDALADPHTDDGRVGPLAPFGLPGRAAGAGADDWTKTGTRLFHDIPSRSANSVLTPENERRSSAHCACGAPTVSAMNRDQEQESERKG